MAVQILAASQLMLFWLKLENKIVVKQPTKTAWLSEPSDFFYAYFLIFSTIALLVLNTFWNSTPAAVLPGGHSHRHVWRRQ